ncbi:MAG TPA: hypothetical protein VFL29_08385 [Candidatus Dormibacteraeota bacterium]|nr:hypothetical protein [Candidatus Dormibacteraeota bacterium]
MSDDKDDLELEALQRKLDDAFATTRPRRGFEDELWLRMQARRPLWTRLRDGIASLGSLVREAPAIPLGAVAVLLVVVIGAGILLNSGLNSSKASHGALSQAPAPADLALGEFGKLPTPALHPGLVDQGVPNSSSFAAAPTVAVPSNLYFGPANLRWTGQLPVEPPARALVYRYSEPGPELIGPFVNSLGATSKQATAPGYLGTYSGPGLTVSVRGTIPQLPREPFFVLTSANGAGATGTDPQTIAMNFLSYYGLFPTWPAVDGGVQQSGQQARVVFMRAFQLTTAQLAQVVDWNGERYGMEVDLINSQVRTVSGPLPLSLDSTTYRLISNEEAVRMALASPPASSQSIEPMPTVNLNTLEEVYVLAVSGNQGYYEPAYLFSGTFSYNGQTYTKRVLVPLVDPTLRS